MEPGQRNSCSTLSMVTSWITFRSLFNKGTHFTWLSCYRKCCLIQVWVSNYYNFWLYSRSCDRLKGAYTQPASRRPPCLKFLPASSFSWLLWFIFFMFTWQHQMLAWFYIYHIYCFVMAYTPRRVDGYIQRMFPYVNKWSSTWQLFALVITLRL